jgi:hypothetical protein
LNREAMPFPWARLSMEFMSGSSLHFVLHLLLLIPSHPAASKITGWKR